MYEVDREYFRSDFGPAEPVGRRQTRPVERESTPYPLQKNKGFMYLHIGDNFSIPMNSILTMIHAESGKHHRTGISHYDAEVIYIVPVDKVKTYIVTDDGVYASGISLKTLKKRIDEFYMLLSSKL